MDQQNTKFTKREREIIYFALSRMLDAAAETDRSAQRGNSEEWNKIDTLRDRFRD